MWTRIISEWLIDCITLCVLLFSGSFWLVIGLKFSIALIHREAEAWTALLLIVQTLLSMFLSTSQHKRIFKSLLKRQHALNWTFPHQTYVSFFCWTQNKIVWRMLEIKHASKSKRCCGSSSSILQNILTSVQQNSDRVFFRVKRLFKWFLYADGNM